jgi:hypothetical protein
MPWVRFDDALGDDPRIATAGVAGAGALLLALCYANRNLTDGWIPAAVLRRILLDGSTDEAAEEAKGRLLQTCLLSESKQNGLLGYQIHADYVLLQPKREEVLKQRGGRSRQKVEAGRLGGIASGEARRKQPRSRTEAQAKHQPSTDEAPVPVPVPLKDKSTGAVAPAHRERDVATHGLLCKIYQEDVMNVFGAESFPDRVEYFKKAVVLRKVQAESIDALNAAIRAVERLNEVGVGAGSRGGGFRQVAS